MTKPKKKLPTGPISIPSKALVTAGADSSNSQENKIPGSKNLENKKPGSGITDSTKPESVIPESTISSDDKVLLVEQESAIPDSNIVSSRKQDSRKQESTKVESGLTEIKYKKVAMRLSEGSVAKLRGLKMSTGIPYEVILDSFIRNWEVLPTALMDQILMEAKEERIKRLVAGQEKATKTVRKKLEDI